jgi:hypothetical protein
MQTDLILGQYLAEIARVRATGAGTGETSYYSALQGALSNVGDGLRPKVICLSQMSGTGVFPDFGLFTQPQLGRGGIPTSWPNGPVPERGVVEADDIPAPLSVKRTSTQVSGYLKVHGLVLITNYRDFELLEQNVGGAIQVVERFSFGRDVVPFFTWAAATRRPEDGPIAVGFAEFLQRVLLRRAPLADPKSVAFFLASYARDALARIESRATLPALNSLRDALGQSLGLTFEPGKGEHLFRSTLIQTLYYGLFSAWVTHARAGGGAFDWRLAEWSLHVPMVRALYEQVATPTHLQPLGLVELLTWASQTLDRVDRTAFFAAFDDEHAIQYFYEPFLEAFDPELRRQMGVWYTPVEVVRYMVERVDRALRSELLIPDGLADPNVWILDPACGTGSFVVEALRRIERTLREKGEDAGVAAELKAAAVRRVAGFEIMPAPFIVAHWQIGNLLRQAGAPLDGDTGERAAVYLTNSLTGWNSAGPDPHLPFPEMETERDLAADVKRTQPILVVLGNPPYSAFDGASPAQEGDLIEPYKEGLRQIWRVRRHNLNDLYVRFLRIAERRIAETTRRGIVCYVTNFSYLAYRSFVVMRQRFVQSFDDIWIDSMNGDSRQTGKITPDGRPDPSVFSTPSNPEGIQVGAAVALMVRRHGGPKTADVRFRHFWGATKRADLLSSLDLSAEAFEATYQPSNPTADNRFTLLPDAALEAYRHWPSLAELSERDDWSGVVEKRKGSLMGYDLATLQQQMADYCDPAIPFQQLAEEGIGPVAPAARFDPVAARINLLNEGGLAAGRFTQVALHPYDHRWCFHTNVRPVWNEPRPRVDAEQRAGNTFIATRTQARKADEGFPVFATRVLPGDHLLDPNTHPFPVVLHRDGGGEMALDGGLPHPNLSPAGRHYLRWLGKDAWLEPGHPDGAAVWLHTLAIAYSPEWLEENQEAIRQDWPRVPMPGDPHQLRASAALGKRIADLLDPTVAVSGVTAGQVEPALRTVAVLSKVGGGSVSGQDLALLARWGVLDASRKVMPGPGKLEQRSYTETERACAEEAAVLGERTADVFLNSKVYWRNVPAEVWDFTIGGFQPLKKWLSYRERSILQRPLTIGETGYFRDIARRLAKVRLLGPDLDANYRACADAAYPWRSPPPAPSTTAVAGPVEELVSEVIPDPHP